MSIETDLAKSIVTEAKAKWIGTYVTEPEIVVGEPSKYKGDTKEYILVFARDPSEEGRVNDNSAKIAIDGSQVICYSETEEIALKYRLMMEQIVEQYTYSNGGGFWTSTFQKMSKSNDLWITPLFVTSKLFRVREVIS